MTGKGSKPRPMSVSRDHFNKNFDKIFGKSNLSREEQVGVDKANKAIKHRANRGLMNENNRRTK